MGLSTVPKLFVSAKGSRYVDYLKKANPAPICNPKNLPKTIYIFWDANIDNAPDMIKYCADSWRKMNPGWQVFALDQNTANEFVDRTALPKNIKTAHYADILRTRLLSSRGGVWVDATSLCLRSLDSWLLPIFNQTEFFCFCPTGRGRVIDNWFLASSNNNEIILKWDYLTREYWKNPKPNPPYFWHHYLFEYSLWRYQDVKKAFDHMPRFNAEVPHLMKRYMRKRAERPFDIDRIRNTYVQKLTYKRGYTVGDVKELLRSLGRHEISALIS
jgi:hypothetical protein